MGWRDRAFYLDPAHTPFLFDRAGNAGSTVWVDGRIVGCWVQDDDERVQLVLMEEVSADARAPPRHRGRPPRRVPPRRTHHQRLRLPPDEAPTPELKPFSARRTEPVERDRPRTNPVRCWTDRSNGPSHGIVRPRGHTRPMAHTATIGDIEPDHGRSAARRAAIADGAPDRRLPRRAAGGDRGAVRPARAGARRAAHRVGQERGLLRRHPHPAPAGARARRC